MAVQAKTPTLIPSRSENAHTIVWVALANGDSGDPLEMPGSADRSIQFTGTFGAGGTVIVEGSNEITPTNWVNLRDPQGTALSFTAAGLKAVLEVTRWIRPRVTGGDGTTAIVATMCVRRNNR
jgi:hypothetical protein